MEPGGVAPRADLGKGTRKEPGTGRAAATTGGAAAGPNEGTAGDTRGDTRRGTIEVMAGATGTTKKDMAGPTVERLIDNAA